ncbi:MAG TPA: hypothetical protein VJP85_07020 [Candidatus Baltobacteraceae bacterium]|nr:hypothetical protein [Candidatus Baltobacteraceae bacterium]
MSVIVEAQGSDGTTSTTIANNTGTPSTTLNFSAPVGSDNFYVSLYDQPQPAGATSPTGQELGQAEVTQTINAGVLNTVNFTVDGIVAELGIALAQGSTMAELNGKIGSQQITMVGDVPTNVVVTPMDADGNAILAPGTVPVPTLTVGAASTGGITVTPSQSNPNEYMLTLNGASTNGSFGLTASATDGQGGTATSNITIVVSPAIYVGYGSGSGSRIVVYDHSGNPLSLGQNAFTGVTQPVGLAYDQDDKELFVADASGKLLAFDGAGNPSTSFAPVNVPGISTISYINASQTPFWSVLPSLSDPKRVLVGGTGGIAEYSTTTGNQDVQAAVGFTPTALAGYYSPFWSQYNPDPASGWFLFAGDPAGNIDFFDLASLSADTADNTPLNGDVATSFAGGFYGHVLGNCVSGGTIYNDYAHCLYVASASTKHIDRLGDFGGLFGSNVPGSFDQGAAGAAAAIAFDPANLTLDAVDSSANTVTYYTINDTWVTYTQPLSFGLTSAGSFTTPASLGLSAPNSIAVEW